MRLQRKINERLVDDPAEREALKCIRSMRMSPWAINNGWCWGFANQLAKRLGDEAKVVGTTQMPGVFPGHSVVLYKGKYYDAESPQGVVDPTDLAYSKRLRAIADSEPDYEDIDEGKSLRRWMGVVEEAVQDATKAFYFHVTPAKNYNSIMKNGLQPNHNGGNYDQMRWEALSGVYASRYVKQLSDYLNGHLISDFLVIIIEVDTETALPDEDMIDIIFDHLFEPMLRADGLTMYDAEFEEMQPGDERFENYVSRLAKGFHDLAAAKHLVEMNAALLHEAAEVWLEMKLGLDGEAEMVWGDLKDKIVHAYPKMVHPTLGNQHSVRIPSAVGFDGATRIVGIVHVHEDDAPEVLFNEVPEEGKTEVNAFIEELLAD